MLLFVGVVLASCGSSDDGKKLPPGQIAKIEKTVQNLGSGERARSAKCPSDVKAKKNETFECTVTGPTGSVKLTLLNTQGSDFSYEGKIGRAKVYGRADTPSGP